MHLADETDLARGPLETRSGVFQLHRFGEVGIEVGDTLEEIREDRATLITWGAVLSVCGGTPQERGGTDGRTSKEELAGLARNDPT